MSGGVPELAGQSGEPLDQETRAYMEPRFGLDFGHVRVHRDKNASRSARSRNALAYTFRNHIVFSDGRYEPHAQSGRRLIAHELQHVAQQDSASSGASVPAVQRFAGPEVVVSSEAIAQMRALVAEFTTLSESGAIAAAEAAEVTAAVAEAEAALVVATEVVAAGATAVTVGETALVASGGLAADDVTGIGIGDDIAIPFLLIGAAVGFGLGYLIGSSAEEIAAATRAAVDAVQRAIDAMQKAIRNARPPAPIPPVLQQPAPEQQTQPRAQTRPRPVPLPHPDVDTEDDEDRTCRGMAVGQRGGNSCHDAFATMISGVTREWGVETPEGLYVEFDAYGQDRVLYEVKTGYGFLLNTSASTYALRESTIHRFIDQSQQQLAVAVRCGYPLVWVFSDPDVAAFVDGFIQAPVIAVPYQCDEDR